MSEEPRKLSIGLPSTLGSYLRISQTFFGAESEATKYIEGLIAEEPNGDAEEVIADEGQMMYLLATLHRGKEL